MTVKKALRVIVVEDEPLLRDLLVVSLENIPSLSVVASYGDGPSAVARVTHDNPDVALLDINLGTGGNGIETGLQLRKSQPLLGIVLLSNYARPDLLSELPRTSLPGWSYLLKKSVRDLATLTRAIEGSASNLVVLDPELVRQSQTRRDSPLNHLTPRQSQILALVAQGYTNAAIAKTLFLSEKSVENYLTTIYSTLHIESSSPDQHARVKATLCFLSQKDELP
ncbi:MAG: DNA-binding response regulator [Sulfobacillus acidophilus]|uniref:Stage 0 sporulation protein A homolog n=1 Tax=Sulfobacillus acidophilus TaxID=53633 RepID=A0A2T2WF24_9FIRM|nr:MAG: DNA-binding response regulator [Sulfobacillus acidophilus]